MTEREQDIENLVNNIIDDKPEKARTNLRKIVADDVRNNPDFQRRLKIGTGVFILAVLVIYAEPIIGLFS